MTNIHTPLGNLDSNAQMANPFDTTPDANAKPAATFTQESQQHRSLHNKLLRQEQTGKQQGGAYVSPSDELMSPASAKLNAFKEKRFTKAKPRSLFGKSNLSSNTPFGGIDENVAVQQRKEDDTKMSEG